MPRTPAAASWVSPSTRRCRRNADRMQACKSLPLSVVACCGPGLNSRAPIAAAKRAVFDRYPGVGVLRCVAIGIELRLILSKYLIIMTVECVIVKQLVLYQHIPTQS